MEGIEEFIENLLHDIQTSLFNKALAHREANTRTVETYEEFKVEIEKGGFILAHWDGTAETESKVKEETQATIRCIALDQVQEEGTCMVTGNPSTGRVIFAKAY
jgi:prolyl-tRNA synthetase